MSVLNVLRNFYSDKAWTLSGDTYNKLEWLDDSPKPTEAEIQALEDKSAIFESATKEITELKTKLAATDYVGLSDYDQDKTAVKADRQTWRERIRTLETTIEGLMS